MESDRWQTLIDQELRKALGDGRADHLPGAGKPLKLNDDPSTPEDLRMAYKIMRDNDITPEWISLGKDLETMLQRLQEHLAKAVRDHHSGLAGIQQVAPELRADYRHNVERRWQTAQRTLEAMVNRYNDRVMTYNLKVPPAVPHRHFFHLDREVERALKS